MPAEIPGEIVVVPHTHWDREWYEPFQRFRLRLVSLMDELLDAMEADPSYRFTLDGQLACVDDYLEVRPEARDRIAALVRDGRLAIGPWQILLDEFLCSGENIIRNLALGMERSEKLGAAMPVGYLPDMFGHIAQMPQILRGAGLEYACIYRGVPSWVSSDTVAWVAPDGTAVRTQYLPEGGYGNGAHLFGDPDALGERVAEFTERMRAWHPEGPILAMYGADHSAPGREMTELAARIGRLATLDDYVATGGTEGLPRLEGELRSHARANILPGVISVRPRLKQLMGRAERMVERYAEPLAALHGTGKTQRFLDMAWWRLIDASGHDSVTGCGVDETAQQVAARIAEAEHLGHAVRDLVTAPLAESVPRDGVLVWNPSPFPRSGVILVDLPGAAELVGPSGQPVASQTLAEEPTVLFDGPMKVADALQCVHGEELYGQQVNAWAIEDGVLTFHVGKHPGPEPFDVAEVRHALGLAEVERVRIIAAPRRTVAALVEVPPLGTTTLVPGEAGTPSGDPQDRPGHLSNGLLDVDVAEDGTFSVVTQNGTEIHGAGRIVEGGDLGDTYNYAPPADDRLVSEPEFVRIEPVARGPIVTAVDVVRGYRWPVAGEGDSRTAEAVDTTVTMRVELRRGEPFVRLRLSFDNRCDDHRVRLNVPLPAEATSSYAEGQFAVVERGMTSEGGVGEVPLPTFPASSWVAAGGAGVLLEHVTEYEVAEDELAITLLRSVGYLSRNRNANRVEPAGPQIATPDAQSRGERTVSLALMPYAGSWDALPEAAETFRHDLLAVPGTGTATAEPVESPGLSVEGAVMTSLRSRDGWLELRAVRQSDSPGTAVIRGGFAEARRADLRGRPGDAISVSAGAIELPARPWEIVTLQLR